jgi:hypothetical protein
LGFPRDYCNGRKTHQLEFLPGNLDSADCTDKRVKLSTDYADRRVKLSADYADFLEICTPVGVSMQVWMLDSF